MTNLKVPILVIDQHFIIIILNWDGTNIRTQLMISFIVYQIILQLSLVSFIQDRMLGDGTIDEQTPFYKDLCPLLTSC